MVYIFDQSLPAQKKNIVSKWRFLIYLQVFGTIQYHRYVRQLVRKGVHSQDVNYRWGSIMNCCCIKLASVSKLFVREERPSPLEFRQVHTCTQVSTKIVLVGFSATHTSTFA